MDNFQAYYERHGLTGRFDPPDEDLELPEDDIFDPPGRLEPWDVDWDDDVPMDDGPLDFYSDAPLYIDATTVEVETIDDADRLPPRPPARIVSTVPARPKRGDPFAAGTRPTAVIVDMDGTLDTETGRKWALEQHRKGHIIIIVTARDQKYDYRRSFDQARNRLGPGVPFIGPFCRASDDMRFACDFKLHVYQSLSLIYDIVAAIDDDRWVLATFAKIPGLEAVPCHPLRTHSRNTLDRGDYPRNMPWDKK